MNQELIAMIEREIQTALTNTSNIFETFGPERTSSFETLLTAAERFYQAPAHDMTSLRTRDATKTRGDFFEHFCYLYLTRLLGWQVWLLSDLPPDKAQLLGLGRDMGIDLIGYHKGGYYAVQAKYRNRTGKTRGSGSVVVSWKTLSTFYALVSRTGPYVGHWVMTTADCVRHVGKKSDKDHSVCFRRFAGLSRLQWMTIAGVDAGRLVGQNELANSVDSDAKVSKPTIRLKSVTAKASESEILERKADESEKSYQMRLQRVKLFTSIQT